MCQFPNWGDETQPPTWNLCYNHCGGENSIPAAWARGFVVIGDYAADPRDEELLKLDPHCPNGVREENAPWLIDQYRRERGDERIWNMQVKGFRL
jgi:hypothetical protein